MQPDPDSDALAGRLARAGLASHALALDPRALPDGRAPAGAEAALAAALVGVVAGPVFRLAPFAYALDPGPAGPEALRVRLPWPGAVRIASIAVGHGEADPAAARLAGAAGRAALIAGPQAVLMLEAGLALEMAAAARLPMAQPEPAALAAALAEILPEVLPEVLSRILPEVLSRILPGVLAGMQPAGGGPQAQGATDAGPALADPARILAELGNHRMMLNGLRASLREIDRGLALGPRLAAPRPLLDRLDRLATLIETARSQDARAGGGASPGGIEPAPAPGTGLSRPGAGR